MNPTGITGIGDPFVLKASDGKYYMYATTDAIACKGFFCWQSSDLRSWSEGSPCYLINEDSFGCGDYWAPEVVEHNGNFVMHYSARNSNGSLRIGVAVSKNPQGIFKDATPRQPMFDFGYAAIDGHVFFDDDGRSYFYFSRDCSENIIDGRHESHIYVAELSDDLLTLKGEARFLFAPEKDYETKAHISGKGETFLWNEGPFMLKKDGEYHLMYSANFYATHDYCICAAVGKNPLGPFVKYNKPVAVYVKGKISGPGHNSVFVGPDGEMRCAYHVHTYYDRPGSNRQMFIDKLEWKRGRLSLKPTIRRGLPSNESDSTMG